MTLTCAHSANKQHHKYPGQFKIPLTKQALLPPLSQRTLHNTIATIFHVMIMWHVNVAQAEIPINRQFLVHRTAVFGSGQTRSRCWVATLTRPPVTGTCTPLHNRKIHQGRHKGRCNTDSAMTSLAAAPPYTCVMQFCPTCYTHHLLGNATTVVRIHCVCIQVCAVKHNGARRNQPRHIYTTTSHQPTANDCSFGESYLPFYKALLTSCCVATSWKGKEKWLKFCSVSASILCHFEGFLPQHLWRLPILIASPMRIRFKN
jgi:hypothetical protein